MESPPPPAQAQAQAQALASPFALALESTNVNTDDADTASIHSRHTLKTLGPNRSHSSISLAYHDHDPNHPDPIPDPWRAIPPTNTVTLTTSHPDPASALAPLNPIQRRRLLLRAALHLLALFLLCLLALGGTLWLALPVIDKADKPAFRIPRSFEQLKQLNTVLKHYKSENYARVMLCWIIIYMFLQAFSIPGSMYMSILAGALFGVPVALPLVCVSVATGATICYLISKLLGVILVALPSWQTRIDDWKLKLSHHNDDMLSYLIIIRMMPLPPHNLVNILAPHLGIPIPKFWISTALGILPVSIIHTTLGEKLDQISSEQLSLLTARNLILLLAVISAVLAPVLIRKYRRAHQVGPIHLPTDV